MLAFVVAWSFPVSAASPRSHPKRLTPAVSQLEKVKSLFPEKVYSKGGILMAVPNDEIAKVEAEGMRRTEVSDWNGARTYFEQALTFDMPPLRQAEILRNIALTHFKEGNQQGAADTVQRAIAILDSAGLSAERLRNDLYTMSSPSDISSGKLPLSTFWYTIVFLAGLYWGVSVASGAPMNPMLVYLGPPIICLFMAVAAVGGLNTKAVYGAVTLYVNFLFSFGIGYAVAAFGIIRFDYRPK